MLLKAGRAERLLLAWFRNKEGVEFGFMGPPLGCHAFCWGRGREGKCIDTSLRDVNGKREEGGASR